MMLTAALLLLLLQHQSLIHKLDFHWFVQISNIDPSVYSENKCYGGWRNYTATAPQSHSCLVRFAPFKKKFITVSLRAPYCMCVYIYVILSMCIYLDASLRRILRKSLILAVQCAVCSVRCVQCAECSVQCASLPPVGNFHCTHTNHSNLAKFCISQKYTL